MTTQIPAWLSSPIKPLDKASKQAALERQANLTKPAGSLGQLEKIAVKFAAMQATTTPQINNIHIAVFAADHGIAKAGVSAFPQSVTAEMVRNFAHGGAAISVLAKQLDAQLSVINLGTIAKVEPLDRVEDKRIAAGTANFLEQPAMTMKQCIHALTVGQETVDNALKQGCDLFIAGEMGIGNTSSATAIASVLLKRPVTELVGPGTGLNDEGISHKAGLLIKAIEKHQLQLTSPIEILRHLGGFEIAALTGAYIHCTQLGLPVVIDGYISTAAALLAEKMLNNCSDWFVFSHQSAEPGHRLMMHAFKQIPLLDFGMRLGEASGAASLVPMIKLSLALHNEMATFADAAVSGKIE